MIIALTGTPGTGKTSVAENLKNEGFEVVDLTKFVKQRGLGEPGDEFEVDIPEMVEALEKEIDREKDIVIEGHLSHHFEADYCIALRCNPEELRERLSTRDYSEQKIEENVESEILDIILSEAVHKQDDIIEVDTTERSAERVAEEVIEKVENGETGFGSVDWTEYL
ncbi:MAG: adenylate kinase family protein [Nanohaloarchaea archaeon]|nr:adenylate kinase family protein [Candidatus Nanohaloarchaea archaeon]